MQEQKKQLKELVSLGGSIAISTLFDTLLLTFHGIFAGLKGKQLLSARLI